MSFAIRGARIALGCRSKVGQLTFANHMINRYGGVKWHLKQSIYDIIAAAQRALGQDIRHCPDMLHAIGGAVRGVYGDGVTAEMLARESQLCDDRANIVITDVQYSAELRVLKAAGFTTIFISRPSLRTSPHLCGTPYDVDCGLSATMFDHEIINAGSLDDYLRGVDDLIRRIMKDHPETAWVNSLSH